MTLYKKHYFNPWRDVDPDDLTWAENEEDEQDEQDEQDEEEAAE